MAVVCHRTIGALLAGQPTVNPLHGRSVAAADLISSAVKLVPASLGCRSSSDGSAKLQQPPNGRVHCGSGYVLGHAHLTRGSATNKYVTSSVCSCCCCNLAGTNQRHVRTMDVFNEQDRGEYTNRQPWEFRPLSLTNYYRPIYSARLVCQLLSELKRSQWRRQNLVLSVFSSQPCG